MTIKQEIRYVVDGVEFKTLKEAEDYQNQKDLINDLEENVASVRWIESWDDLVNELSLSGYKIVKDKEEN